MAIPVVDSPVFELQAVSFGYGAQVALHDVSLRVDAGEQVAILGANGSGKSTLLKIMDALYFPTAGDFRAFGESVTEAALAEEERALAFRRRVGFLFQDSDVQLFSPTVWDEVTFAPLHLGLPAAEVVERAEWALDLLGIGKLRERAPHRLSGGEKKKVAIASVLSLRPAVWLLDEPTAGLDPRSISRLLDFLADLREEGMTVVTATHDLEIVQEIADRAVVFSEAHSIVGEGTPAEVLANREQLLECNLLHEHRHRHGDVTHRHEHLHRAGHSHQ